MKLSMFWAVVMMRQQVVAPNVVDSITLQCVVWNSTYVDEMR